MRQIPLDWEQMNWVSVSRHREYHWRGIANRMKGLDHSDSPRADDALTCHADVQIHLLLVLEECNLRKSTSSIGCHTDPSVKEKE